MKKIIIMFFTVLLLTSCKNENVVNNAYDSDEVIEYDYLKKEGVSLDEVDEDARLYLNSSEDKKSIFIGLNMSKEDVSKICSENDIEISDPVVLHAGDIMKGWWFDGTSSSQIGEEVFIKFDKAGNVYEIIFNEGYSTARGINTNSSLEDIINAYGEPYSTVNIEGVATEYSYWMDNYYIRFAFANDDLMNISISETVMDYVLYEHMQ